MLNFSGQYPAACGGIVYLGKILKGKANRAMRPFSLAPYLNELFAERLKNEKN